ncbi:hypothetical protein HPB48_023344 [Haemaphysalis longicornis]|uniref:Reverse transcriptase domain-containing protein n=1 Tax=Haemaphysalis longicornis TaxID=44386 RepID=A0A9J6H502_HAELO|nr:hypothetical protein HPB48_023344 [Haemaphysalis longicornis]
MLGFRQGLSTQDETKLVRTQSISDINIGHSFHSYVKLLQPCCKGTLKVGENKSQEYSLGSGGMPQGAVISPVFVNLAMKKLSVFLSGIKRSHHTIRSDDILFWYTQGSEGEVELNLKKAVYQTETPRRHRAKVIYEKG